MFIANLLNVNQQNGTQRFASKTDDNFKQKYIILPVNSAVWYSVTMKVVTERSAKYCHICDQKGQGTVRATRTTDSKESKPT